MESLRLRLYEWSLHWDCPNCVHIACVNIQHAPCICTRVPSLESSHHPISFCSAGCGWCWFVVRKNYCRLAGGWCWFGVREKYCWLAGSRCWFGVRKKITTGLLNDKPAEQSVYNQYGHEWEIKEWLWLFVELKSFTDIYRCPKTTCTCAYSSKQFNNLD